MNSGPHASSDREPGPDTSSPGSESLAPAFDLSARVVALLDQLGGRSAVAARGRPRLVAGVGAHGARAELELAIRADEPFPSASVIKVPIAVELARRVDLGAFDFSERIDISGEPRAGGGGVLQFLDPGWQPTLADLCSLMLAVSDNTAANVLLDLLGMGEVNFSMERLGLRYTRLARRFMDLAARAAGRDNTTSAADMVRLLSLLADNALPLAGRIRAMMANDARAEAVTFALPADATLIHKTGTMDDTLHDAGILSGPGGTCIYCVLTTAQQDLSSTVLVIAHVLRLFWDGWCATDTAAEQPE
jgi:beta-lactamase class A